MSFLFLMFLHHVCFYIFSLLHHVTSCWFMYQSFHFSFSIFIITCFSFYFISLFVCLMRASSFNFVFILNMKVVCSSLPLLSWLRFLSIVISFCIVSLHFCIVCYSTLCLILFPRATSCVASFIKLLHFYFFVLFPHIICCLCVFL